MSWFAVPLIVMVLVVGMRAVKVVPPTLIPFENVCNKDQVLESVRSVDEANVQVLVEKV